MAKKFTTWGRNSYKSVPVTEGGVRINTSKTPKQLVDQLNRQMSSDLTDESYDRVQDLQIKIFKSTAAKRYGIETDPDTGKFYLNRKGRANKNTPIAAIGGTNG